MTTRIEQKHAVEGALPADSTVRMLAESVRGVERGFSAEGAALSFAFDHP